MIQGTFHSVASPQTAIHYLAVFDVTEGSRNYNCLSTDLYKASEYERLALSLVSPLPNEQDFAINVCTLLSNENKNILRMDKHPRLLTFLLAHAAVFNHGNKTFHLSGA